MADLLSSAENAQLQQGFLDAMDTLHRSPIKLFVKSLSLDIRQINTDATYVEYNLKTIVKEKNKQNQEGIEGSRDINQIEVKFHKQDFIDLSLIDIDGKILFNSSESYFNYLGKNYRIVSIQQEDIAVRIEAESSPIVIASMVAPEINYSMILNGINQYIYSPITPVYDFEYNTTFTLSCWVKLETLKALNIFNHLDTTTGRGYFLFMNPNGGLQFDLRANGNTRLSVASPNSVVSLNQWHHIAVTYNGSITTGGLNIYLDGAALTKATTFNNLGTNSIKVPSLPLVIGAFQLGSINLLDGLVDEIRIWNIALTPTDINAEFNGKGLTIPVQSTNLIGQPDINNAVYNINSFDMIDKSGNVSDYKTANIPVTGRSLDVPI